MKRGIQWPIGVALVLATTVVGDVWIAIVASRDRAFAVEPDYYQKAVHFDDELARPAASARLGWTVTPTLQLGRLGSPGTVSIVVRDAADAPVTGARVELLAMHNARATHQLVAALAERGGGAYAAPLDAERPGEWELRFVIARGTDRFAVRTRVDALVPR